MGFNDRVRIYVSAAATSVVATTLIVLAPGSATAAGTALFDQPFHNNAADGDGAVVLPLLAAAGTNFACLSAAGNPGPAPLHSCSTFPDVQGSGKLRLTDTQASKIGGVFAATSVPTSGGIDVTFNTYQYGGSFPADGLAFALAAVDPANPLSPPNVGPSGGSLGYSAFGNVKGLAYAYMGFGFDVYGNFSAKAYEGSGCVDPPYIAPTGRVPGQVLIRGPGNGLVGYCAINSTATAAVPTPPVVPIRAANRAASRVPVEVVMNPTASSLTTASGLVVPANTYQIVFTPVGQTARTMQGTLPAVTAGLFPASWLTAGGIPKQLAFGWVGSTGANTDFHEVDAVKVVSLGPVPELTVSQTAYARPTLAPGDPVTYTVVSGVQTGAAETAPVSVTDTLPAGVVPVGGAGTGWICQSPSGQSITCTNSNGPFAAGSTLPVLTITGTVVTTGITPATVQNNTVVTASSADANPAYSSVAAAGTTPTAPSLIVVTPSSGPAGTPAVVTGLNIAGATAIQVGTAAELAAATGKTMTPCIGGVPAAGCFTVNGSGDLVISGMPVHFGVPVLVKVITLGVAANGTYSYVSAPGTPPATATAGIASATVSWTPPASGGSPITGYIVTPTKDGVVQAPISYGPGVTTTTINGLTPKSSYTFTVAAENVFGVGTPSAPTAAVVPYALPSAPTIGTASGGSSAATVRWTAPADDGGRPVTAYVVTPYIGAIAQAPQTFVSTATTQIVTGLTPGTTYTFTVSAKNLAGTGPASAASNPVLINPGPTLAFPAPPSGVVGVPYSQQLTVSGGTSPMTWSVSAGLLPPGLTLGADTGLLSGTPTAAGSYHFTVRVTDSYGQTATKAVTLVIQVGATVTLTTSDPAVRFGTTVTLTATVSPSHATGTVSFADSVVSGPLAGTTIDLGTVTVAGGEAALTRTVPAFGVNTIVATYSGDASHAGATTTASVVEVYGYLGQVVITEMRTSGPAGLADDYVELYNTGPPVPLAGLVVVSGAGAPYIIPATAPTLGTGRSYLLAGGSYSLAGVAPADQSLAGFGTTGIRLYVPDSAGTRIDAVGPASGAHLGVPLPAMTGSPTAEWAWVRLQAGGRPLDTHSNATDFVLVSSSGGVIGGVQSMLGSASPTGVTSSYQQNVQAQSFLLDPSLSADVEPNRGYVAGNPGTLVIRRTITNGSSEPITAATLRITALSEANGAPRPGGGTQPRRVALLRLIDPQTPTSQVVVAGRGTVTVQNLHVDAPIVGPPGGGMNSTLTIALPGGVLAPGASVDVALTFAVDLGGTYWIGYDVDVLLAGGPVSAAVDDWALSRMLAVARPGDQPAPFAAGSL